jgi:hypothetical protein
MRLLGLCAIGVGTTLRVVRVNEVVGTRSLCTSRSCPSRRDMGREHSGQRRCRSCLMKPIGEQLDALDRWLDRRMGGRLLRKSSYDVKPPFWVTIRYQVWSSAFILTVLGPPAVSVPKADQPLVRLICGLVLFAGAGSLYWRATAWCKTHERHESAASAEASRALTDVPSRRSDPSSRSAPPR